MRGKDFWSERLAEDHAIFHAFFDIEGGMPNNSGTAQGKSGVLTWNHMTGHFIKGRMVGLTSNGWSWGSPAGVRLAVNGRPRSAQSPIHACGSGISTRCPDWIDCTAQIPGKVICAARIGPIGAVVPSRMAWTKSSMMPTAGPAWPPISST